VFDIRCNILSYAAHRLYTLDEEKLYFLNAIRLSDGKLSSTVFGQCTPLLLVPCWSRHIKTCHIAGTQVSQLPCHIAGTQVHRFLATLLAHKFTASLPHCWHTSSQLPCHIASTQVHSFLATLLAHKFTASLPHCWHTSYTASFCHILGKSFTAPPPLPAEHPVLPLVSQTVTSQLSEVLESCSNTFGNV
jgi:hypothetical protein